MTALNAMDEDPPAPASTLTDVELAHYQSLGALYTLVNGQSRAPETTPELRELLLPRVALVWGEMTDMNEIALGRDTVDLKAEAEDLHPAIVQLQQFCKELDAYSKATGEAFDVLQAVDVALSTAKALGISV